VTQQASSRPVFPANIAPYIDVGAYLLDSRAPAATLWLDQQLVGRELFLLTRADQADPAVTKRWQKYFKDAGYPCITLSSTEGTGIERIKDYLAMMLKKKTKLAASRGISNPTLRMVSLGVPNVGKSTFLNALISARKFRTGNKPGVTRGPQWVRLFEDVEVLDTPGILRDMAALRRRKPYWLLLNLMPYDANDTVLREQALDLLIDNLPEKGWNNVSRIYRIRDLKQRREQGTLEILEGVAAARGYRITTADHVERATLRLIHDFQAGKLGPLSLEDPETAQISSPIFGRAGASPVN
jgi:ribosome biogenesis GTPase A